MKITKQRLVQIIKEEMEAYDRRDIIDPQEFTSKGRDTAEEFAEIGAMEQFLANLQSKFPKATNQELIQMIEDSLEKAGYNMMDAR
tara:strand:- start:28 stop:285 length:258 start_codon:yes stop_codon:yes gene_type:complete